MHLALARTRRRARGYTLIEIMVTVAIIALLASIALPAYTNYITRGKLVEAYNSLSASSLALEQYYQDNRSYVGGCAALPSSTTNFSYACTLAANAYTLVATGSSTATSGFTYTLTDTGARATPAAPAGWKTSTACWVNNPAGTCQ